MANILNINDAISWAYDLEPAQSNCYYVDYFKLGKYSGDKLNYEFKNAVDVVADNFIKYRLQSISINGISLDLENSFVREAKPLFKKTNKENTVSITWLDDENRTIECAHLNWLQGWYNANDVCLLNGQHGALKILCVKPKSSEINDDATSLSLSLDTALETMDDVFTIELHGLIPTSLPKFKFSYDNTGLQLYEVEYTFSEAIICDNYI